jgi:hypothetical protein
MLQWNPSRKAWSDYSPSHYSDPERMEKVKFVNDYGNRLQRAMIWDFGACTGEYSRLACRSGAYVVAQDSDYDSLDLNYQQIRREKETNILTVLVDLTSPNPNLIWVRLLQNTALEQLRTG